MSAHRRIHPAHPVARPWRVLAAAILVAGLAGCATRPPASPRALVPGTALAMSPGESARLPDGGVVGYVGVRSDSRCPPAVTCVHAGWVELDFVHRAGGGDTALVLSTREATPPVHAGGWRLALMEVGRGASTVAHLRASTAAD